MALARRGISRRPISCTSRLAASWAMPSGRAGAIHAGRWAIGRESARRGRAKVSASCGIVQPPVLGPRT
eukprot:1289812-Pyramimonas_sp.AAC.1